MASRTGRMSWSGHVRCARRRPGRPTPLQRIEPVAHAEDPVRCAVTGSSACATRGNMSVTDVTGFPGSIPIRTWLAAGAAAVFLVSVALFDDYRALGAAPLAYLFFWFATRFP